MNYPIEKLQLYTLNVGYAQHYGAWNWKNIRSPFARLYLVTEGSASIELPTGTYTLTPGHLYLIPAFTTHSYVCDGFFAHYYIHIYENNPDGQGILADWEFPVEVEAASYDGEIIKRLADINPLLKLPMSNPSGYDNHKTLVSNFGLNVRRPFCDKVESRGIIYLLLSRFLSNARERTPVSDTRMRNVIQYIRANVGEDISIPQLADMACMSKDHFIRTFRKTTGETPVAFITRKKMEAAELLLVTTDEPVKNIAVKIGFNDCSYFNKTFKRFAAITPQQYRQQHNCLPSETQNP